MKFLKFLAKEKQILTVHAKDKSCKIPEGLQLY